MTKEKTKEEKTQDSSLSPEPSQPTLPFNPDEIKPTNMYSRGSHGGIDDEYYIIGYVQIMNNNFFTRQSCRIIRILRDQTNTKGR